MATMRAAYIESFGGNEVVKVGPRPVPAIGPRQILIRVHASCVNPRDWLLRDGRYVFRHLVVGFPKVLGSDVSGVVDQVGPLVRGVRLGDEVVAIQTVLGQMGGYAEFMAVREDAVALKPRSMSHAEAAGLPVAGLTALQALRDEVHLARGERVMIVGASGGVGSYAVQVARDMGARVIGVCSGPNEALVRELGADETIDYRSHDVVEAAGEVDVVFDAIGKGTLARYRPCLAPGGRYVSTVPSLDNTRDALASLPAHLLARAGKRSRRLISRTVLCRSRGRDLAVLAGMADAGALRTVIDSTYPLERVTEALARSRTQRARGKIILDVAGSAAAGERY